MKPNNENNILANIIIDLVFFMQNIISYSSFDLGLHYDPDIS